MSANSKIFYEVWGRDTFANETFLCGKFSSPESAFRLCHEKEMEVAKFQDPELRDTFWVIEISAQEIEERNRMEELKRNQMLNEQYYDRLRLQQCCAEILQQLRKKAMEVDENEVVKNSKEKNLILLATQELNCSNPEDCYSKIKLELKVVRSNLSLMILPELTFKRGEYTGEGTCSKAIEFFKSMEDVMRWLNDENSPEKLYVHLSNMIEKYYD